MKNIWKFCLAAVVVMVVNTGCPGPGGEPHVTVYSDLTEISGTIESFDELPAGEYTLKLIAYNDDDEDFAIAIAQCPISASGEFTLELPMTVGSEFLYSSRDDFEDAPSSITISHHFNMTDADLKIYDSGDEIVGYLSYEGSNYSNQESIISNVDFDSGLIYADDSGSIKGSFIEGEENVVFDLEIKKGWNWMYYLESETYGGGQEEYTSITTSTLPFEGAFVVHSYE